MDIVSHGLWGSLAFGRRNRRDFWLAFLFGIVPDLLSFGLFTLGAWTGFFDHPDWRSGQHPDPSQIPLFVHMMYDYTHSLIIFFCVFLLVSIIRKAPFLPLAAWGLHILVDIPTHSQDFFPTPFLWPISEYTVNGIAWSHPAILLPDVILLIVLYAWFFVIRCRRDRQKVQKVL